MLTLEDENNLDDEVVERVCQAEASGKPISALRGPKFDVRLKKALDLPYHQGVLCAAVNRLVHAGMLRREESSEEYAVCYGTGAPHTYPIATVLPG